MTDTQAPKHRRGGKLQTKALAGLVAIMFAAAIVALVFVSSGGGSKNHKQAGAAPRRSDVGHTSSAPAPKTSTSSTSARPAATTSASSSPTAASTSAKNGAATKTVAPTQKSPSSAHSSDTKKVVYTVKKGDTLTAIGRWYSDHGYLKLYNWNKSVIGQNPDLIFPGQKIIVVDGHVGVARKSH